MVLVGQQRHGSDSVAHPRGHVQSLLDTARHREPRSMPVLGYKQTHVIKRGPKVTASWAPRLMAAAFDVLYDLCMFSSEAGDEKTRPL
jgi:hypothetical protein